MKKRLCNSMVFLMITALFLGGCQKTPENSIVRQKGADSIENYQEDRSSEENSEEAGEISETSGNPLAERLEIPEAYVAEDSSDDGIYTLMADASIEVPKAEKVGVYSVALREVTNEMLMNLHKAFFGDAPVYEGNQYFQMTKGEIQKKIDELKAFIAEGNLDPYGIRESYLAQGGDMELDEVFNLQDSIDSWESTYAEALDEKIKQEVTPAFGLSVPNVEAEITKERFWGAVETEQGVYQCDYGKNAASDKMRARIGRIREDGSTTYSMDWSGNGYDSYEMGYEIDHQEGRPSREEVEKMAGITEEEAISMGNAVVEKLGDEGFTLGAIRLSVHSVIPDTPNDSAIYDDGGYQLHYRRSVNGFPTTYEMNQGGTLESMDSTNDTMGYESLEIVVNKDGIQLIELLNWSEVTGTEVENVELKSFPEISQVFEKMLKVKNSDLGSYMSRINYQVKEVRLGYTRIYDPGSDVTKGLLVPVWDFFGGQEGTYISEGEEYQSAEADPYQSFLTVNAIDGTIIDRGLGY